MAIAFTLSFGRLKMSKQKGSGKKTKFELSHIGRYEEEKVSRFEGEA